MLPIEAWGFRLPSGSSSRGPVALPQELRNDTVAFRFANHPELGAVLHNIEHRASHGDFTFATFNASASAAMDRKLGLWDLSVSRRVPDADEETLTLTPSDATQGVSAYEVRSALGEPGLLLVWRGIRVRAVVEGETIFFVAQLITLREAETTARWQTWVGRERGASVSLEAVESPNIHVRGPVTPRAGESHLAAQRRSRLLIPLAANFVFRMSQASAFRQPLTTLLNGVNWPLYYWSVFDLKMVLPQPNLQQMQFQALYAADSSDPGSFRRILYLATEDRTGYFKQFHHEGYAVDEPDGASGWYNWRAQYVPGYEDSLSQADDKPQTRFGNTYVTPYDAVVGPLLAKTDEFWFDVAERYRTVFDNGEVWPHRTVDDPDRGALTHGAPMVGCIDQRNSARSAGRALFEDCFDAVRTVRKGLDPHGLRTPVMCAHLQNLRSDGIHVECADLPLADNVDQNLAPLTKRAAQDGISTSFYGRPYDTTFAYTPNLAELLPPQAQAYGPDGQLASSVAFLPDSFTVNQKTLSYVLDYGSTTAQTFYLEQYYAQLMRDFGMRGAYTDVFAGIGSLLFYDPPPPLQPSHTAHGGDYFMRGKRASATALREFTKQLAAERGEDPKRYFLGGEAAEEFLADKYDWANAGYGYFGNHLMFAEDVALRWLAEYTEEVLPDDAFSGVPAASRNMSPPLWNLVHHEWAPGQRLVVPWNNVGLATNPHFYPAKHHYPNTADYSGIPPEKFVELYCFTFALMINEGARPSQFVYRRDVDDMLGDVSTGLWGLDDADHAAVDPNLDPNGAGMKLQKFYEMLHRAMHEGPLRDFVLYGRMERSVQVDYNKGDVEMQTNPMFWMFGQDSPGEFDHQFKQIFLGRYVDPGPRETPVPENQRPLLSVSPYPSAAFIGSTYLTGFLRFDSPRVVSSVWRDQGNRLGVVLVNWSGSDTSFHGSMDMDSYGIDAKFGYDVRAFRNGHPLNDGVTFRSPTLRITTLDSNPDALQLPGLPPRSLTLIVVSYTKVSP